jgi:hypothetical protein
MAAFGIGDPGGIQTPDLQNRNLTFYSAELRGRYYVNVSLYFNVIFLSLAFRTVRQLADDVLFS